MLLAVTGMVSASPRCEGLLSSGQQCHQVYSPDCGVGQRHFLAQSGEVYCDCDVTEVEITTNTTINTIK